MIKDTDRRNFLKALSFGTASLAAYSCSSSAPQTDGAVAQSKREVPSYLKDYSELYQEDPRGAATQWFRDAKFGLFIHFGLYSLLGRHEWVQLREEIRVDEYEKLKDRFTAANFDTDFITDLALESEMKYINLVTRHHDSFCLFRTAQTEFNSLNSAAKRDLVEELADSCRQKGLGLFLYYSHGRDWRHPHAPNNDKWGGNARPKYDPPEPRYATGDEHDLQKYLDFMSAQITELLTQYGPVAGIWLDGIGVTRSGDTASFKCQELYDLVHSLQPQVLVSYKQGLLGTEDFFTPERELRDLKEQRGKPLEICDTLQPKGWGYIKEDDDQHKSADMVMEMLANAARGGSNLLLNTGPLPDGSIHPADIATLREVGQRLKSEGFPKPPNS